LPKNKHKTKKAEVVLRYSTEVFFFLILVILGFEFRVSCLLARLELNHLSHSASPVFVLGFF
jgi:hypothetical protein